MLNREVFMGWVLKIILKEKPNSFLGVNPNRQPIVSSTPVTGQQRFTPNTMYQPQNVPAPYIPPYNQPKALLDKDLQSNAKDNDRTSCK